MNAAKIEAVQMALEATCIHVGDMVVVDGHSYPIGNGDSLERIPGEYKVLFIFNNGNLFAKLDKSNREPQVIPPGYIVWKI